MRPHQHPHGLRCMCSCTVSSLSNFAIRYIQPSTFAKKRNSKLERIASMPEHGLFGIAKHSPYIALIKFGDAGRIPMQVSAVYRNSSARIQPSCLISFADIMSAWPNRLCLCTSILSSACPACEGGVSYYPVLSALVPAPQAFSAPIWKTSGLAPGMSELIAPNPNYQRYRSLLMKNR